MVTVLIYAIVMITPKIRMTTTETVYYADNNTLMQYMHTYSFISFALSLPQNNKYTAINLHDYRLKPTEVAEGDSALRE